MRFIQRIAEGRNVIRLCMKRVGADAVLLYRLIEEPIPGSRARRCYMYSLTVTKIDRAGERRQVEHLKDVTRSRSEALRIYTLISHGLVFPESAAEIVSDLISI